LDGLQTVVFTNIPVTGYNFALTSRIAPDDVRSVDYAIEHALIMLSRYAINFQSRRMFATDAVTRENVYCTNSTICTIPHIKTTGSFSKNHVPVPILQKRNSAR
jgi:hypothetical protein